MSIAKNAETENIGDDLLWGVEAISREIKRPIKKTYYGLERGHIDAKKVGAIWVASRRKLRAQLIGE
jgi:hypothetical protein